MVISRTPLRISFFGGGTDYPVWYKNNNSVVISTTINKYVYVTCRNLPPFFDYKYRIRYTEQEYTQRISQIKHPSVRECLRFIGYREGIEMQHNADIPALSGMGSSSAFTVGLLNSLYALKDKMVDKRQLALDAIYVEQKMIGENVGAQDQTAAAYGGLNKMDFGGKQIIEVTPLSVSPRKIHALENNLMLFFTGITRDASKIASSQVKSANQKSSELEKMYEIARQAYKLFTKSKTNMDDIGLLLDESWKVKKTLSDKISNKFIDDVYERARKAGAIGGKLLGAGSGGFMLFYVRNNKQQRVRAKLKNLLHVPFKFENYGSQIIYKMPNDY